MKEINAHAFNFEALDGELIDLSAFKGQVMLVVNTASKCGFTKQYNDLEALHKEFSSKGLVVIGIPSKDFGQQEFDEACDIQNFVDENFKITFQMAGVHSVVGKDAHPFYHWANQQVGILGKPKWNFHKYLIGKEGHLLTWFASTTKPTSKKIKTAIEKALLA